MKLANEQERVALGAHARLLETYSLPLIAVIRGRLYVSRLAIQSLSGER